MIFYVMKGRTAKGSRGLEGTISGDSGEAREAIVRARLTIGSDSRIAVLDL